jgi:Na+-translocating ferredoxin:NAD+ oxidoreductase RnfG subunit
MPAGILQALLSAVAGIFSAINNVFGAKNTKDMKDRQLQQKETNFENVIESAIKERDVKKIRDSLAE